MADSNNLKKQLGKVSELVNDAIRTGDYSSLSDQIGEAVQNAADSFMGNAVDADYESLDSGKSSGDAERKKTGSFEYREYGYRSEGQRNAERYRSQMNARDAQAEHARSMRAEAEERQRTKREREQYENTYFAKPDDQAGATVLTIIGSAIAFIFLLATLGMALIAAAAGMPALPVITGIIGACGLALALYGRRTAKKNKRFKTYRNLLLPKLYMDVKDLSAKSGVPKKQVVEDLEEFTEKGMIRQGHFDRSKKTFMASDEIYRQYLETDRQAAELKRQKKEEEKKRKAEEKKKAEKDAAYTPEVRAILDQGQQYIEHIHSANDAIEDPVVSEKLDRMENIVRRIFEEVQKRPALANHLGMFTDYYLPTTAKLLDAYEELDRQDVQGENIRYAKHEIESSLDTINDAFEKLLDSFFKDKAMDVSSDINVMKMMMKQEGLTEDDMTAAARKQKGSAEGSQKEAVQRENAPKSTPQSQKEENRVLTAPWDTSETANKQRKAEPEGTPQNSSVSMGSAEDAGSQGTSQQAAAVASGGTQAVQAAGGAQAQQMAEEKK